MNCRHPNDPLYATERFHRVFLVLFAPAYVFVLPFLLTAATTWSARKLSPKKRWRVFTVLSLVSATLAAAFVLVRLTGVIDGNLVKLLHTWAASYLAFAAVLLPHTLGRLRVLHRVKAARNS